MLFDKDEIYFTSGTEFFIFFDECEARVVKIL
jgi:hypothetical protein